MTVLTTRDASVFIQFRLGDKSYYLGDCTDLDSIPNPRFGGIDYIYCWNAKRNGYNKKGKKYSGPPDNIEVTLSQLLEETRSWLDQVKCPFTLYALKRTCGDAGVFRNWIRGAILYEGQITSDELTAYGHHVDDNESGHDFTVVAPPPRIDVWKLVASRMTSALTLQLNTVAPCLNLYCDDECGEYTVPGDDVVAGEDGAGGAAPNVTVTEDGGTNWTVTATQPFGIDEDIMSMVCFEISKGVNRLLAVRNAVTGGSFGGDPLEVAYSDDGGATWTNVDVGSTNGEGATGPKSLFSIDNQHIWLVTDEPNIYFSDDGGETWVDQDATAAGANPLNAISGADINTLVAVGDNDTIVYTLDGGSTWLVAGATGTGDDLLSIQCFNPYRWIVGTDCVSGTPLWITFDSGDTWDERYFTGFANEEVTDMSFATPGVGVLISNTAGPIGSIHHTIDGGYTWEEIVPPTNAGFNAVVMIDPISAFVVGHPYGGTSMIVHICV